MAKGLSGHGVLVVEDDPNVREALRDVLEAEGYAVSSASNGREALEQLRVAALPCLILLDIRMPVMDGLEFRTELRRDPALAKIPVVVISAEGLQRDFPWLDTDVCLAKPFEVDALLSLVGRYG